MPPKILIVDDDVTWLRVVSLYLERRGYQVTTTESGEAAIQQVAADHPDLIIADIAMPGMDGFELCSRLRRDARTRTIPFIFLTARDQETDKVKARKIGCDDYLTKPCPLERLEAAVETMIDRVEQARRLPLDRIGLSGRLEEVDVLDLIQMLELGQKTGALVLSHGDRTATVYFQQGVIVEADIQSPKREMPLFVLLGWKAGRFLFVPDAVPERMPITASLANLLFEDLWKLEQHEVALRRAEAPPSVEASETGPASRIVALLEDLGRRSFAGFGPTGDQHLARILVVGVNRSGASELVHHLVKDLSPSRWAAVGVGEPASTRKTDFGLVRLSPRTLLHFVAIRAEKRFRPVWEQCLPDALAAIVLVTPELDEGLSHIRAFLKAKESIAPELPVHALLGHLGKTAERLGLAPSEVSVGSVHEQEVRLEILDRLLQQRLKVG